MFISFNCLSTVRSRAENKISIMAAMVDAKPAASVQGTPLLATATLPVFTRGIYSTKCITLESSSPSSLPPPKPLIIVTPTEKGTYNVILFLHGTSLSNKSYSKIFDHIASHGFIVVAPQVCMLNISIYNPYFYINFIYMYKTIT